MTVITPYHPEHTRFSQDHALSMKDMGQPKWPAISISGAGILLKTKRAARRLSNWLLEYPDLELMLLVAKALRKEQGYDALISIAVPYPVHWGVACVWGSAKKNKPANLWIADCGDPFMGQENDTFTPPFYFEWVEKWFMRKADYITVPVETAIRAYYPEFHEKIKVIPQGFRFEDYRQETEEAKSEHPVFAYGGMFIPGRRDPTELIRFLASTNRVFEFHIYTTTPGIVYQSIPREDNRFIVHEPSLREHFLKQISRVDFVVNFENAGNKQIPSKLIDYALLGKPILNITTGKLDKANVLRFIDGDYSGRLVIQDPDQYRIENVADRFIRLVESSSNG